MCSENDGVKTQPDDVVQVQLENWRDFWLIFIWNFFLSIQLAAKSIIE